MEKKNLPIYGPGPAYIFICAILTVAGIILNRKGLLESGSVELTPVRNLAFVIGIIVIFWLLGIILMVFGAYMWYAAVIRGKIDDDIKNNRLTTTGIYAHVRNPIYSGLTMILTGFLFSEENYWLLILPVFFWLFMTILLKLTEEKWLKKQYGDEYIEYCRKVNRCIPWFIRKEKNQDIENNNETER